MQVVWTPRSPPAGGSGRVIMLELTTNAQLMGLTRGKVTHLNWGFLAENPRLVHPLVEQNNGGRVD